jgi:hypothetical protein
MKREKTNSNFDDLENDASYAETKYLIGLEVIRKEIAIKNPDDLDAQLSYGDVLIFNKKYQEAIDFFYPLYKKNYEEGLEVGHIIDSLIGLGKTEKDFNWIIPPKICHLDTATLDLCTKILNDKKEAVTILDLFDEIFLYQSDHITFDEDEFSNFILQNNDNFILIGDRSNPLEMEIKTKL